MVLDLHHLTRESPKHQRKLCAQELHILAAVFLAETNSRLLNRYPHLNQISFVAVVEFGDKVKAKSMLAGGQSSDVNSPHFSDQSQRYADGDFKDVAFYREDVLKRAKSTYHPGNKK